MAANLEQHSGQEADCVVSASGFAARGEDAEAASEQSADRYASVGQEQASVEANQKARSSRVPPGVESLAGEPPHLGTQADLASVQVDEWTERQIDIVPRRAPESVPEILTWHIHIGKRPIRGGSHVVNVAFAIERQPLRRVPSEQGSESRAGFVSCPAIAHRQAKAKVRHEQDRRLMAGRGRWGGVAIAWLDACDGWLGGGTSCVPASSGGSSSACARTRRGCASTKQDSPARAKVCRRRKSRTLTFRASTTIALRSGIRAPLPTEGRGEDQLVTRNRSRSRNSCRRRKPSGSRPRR